MLRASAVELCDDDGHWFAIISLSGSVPDTAELETAVCKYYGVSSAATSSDGRSITIAFHSGQHRSMNLPAILTDLAERDLVVSARWSD